MNSSDDNTPGFFKAAVTGGLVIIIPLTIIGIVLSSLLDTFIGFADFLEPRLPFGWLGNTFIVAAVSVACIVLLCFLTGLFLLTSPGKRIGAWLDRNIAQKVPLYGMLKNLTAQFAGISGEQFQPVEVDLFGAGSWAPGFIVEELPDGRVAVFVPGVPLPTVGHVYFLEAERIRKIEAPMVDVANALTQWGVGSKLLFSAQKPGSTDPEN